MSLNESLQKKFPHLELSVLKLSEAKKDNESFRIDSEPFKKSNLQFNANLSYIRLDEITNINPSKLEISYLDKNTKVTFLSMQNLGNGVINDKEEGTIRDFESGYTYFAENDILIAKITPCMEHGKCAIAIDLKNKIGFGSTEFNVFRMKDSRFLKEFVFCYLDREVIRKIATDNMVGTSGRQRVPTAFYEKLLIPLLPMPFQLEIEKMVKDSHKALESSKALYKEAEDLLYTELGLNPQNPLDSVLTCFQTPTRPFRGAEHWEKGGSSASANAKLEMDIARHSPISEKAAAFLRAGERGEGAALFAIEENKKSIQSNKNITSCNPPNCTIKTLKESFLKTGRLDSEYYQVKYEEIEKRIKAFKNIQLKDLVDYPISSGATPKAGGSDYTDSKDGIAFIRAVDLKNMCVELANLIYIKPEIHNKNLKRTKLNKGDVLFSIAGVIGRCAIFDCDFEANINQALSILRFSENKGILRLYLAMFFNSKFGQMYLEKYARQGLQTNLNLEEVGNLEIPILNFAVQEQIASHIQKSFIFKEQYKAYRIKDFVLSKPDKKGKHIGLYLGIFFTLTNIDILLFIINLQEEVFIPIYRLVELIYQYFLIDWALDY